MTANTTHWRFTDDELALILDAHQAGRLITRRDIIAHYPECPQCLCEAATGVNQYGRNTRDELAFARGLHDSTLLINFQMYASTWFENGGLKGADSADEVIARLTAAGFVGP